MSHSAEDMQRVSTWVAENCTPETIHILLSELAALRTQLTASEASRKELREAQASAISAMKALRLTILNDGYAATFQTLGQYRRELIRRLTGIIDAALADDAEQKGGSNA